METDPLVRSSSKGDLTARAAEYPPRAERFAVQVPIQCRTAPYGPWHRAEIENISATGLLVRSDMRFSVDRRIEMSFVLSGEVPGVPPANIVCDGRVVRTVVKPDGTSAFGIAIEQRLFVSEANA